MRSPVQHSSGPARAVAMGPSNYGQIIPQFEQKYCKARFLDRVLRSEFSFNGETYHLGDPVDWINNPSGDIEWHILLHKFYYAPGLAAQYRRYRDVRYLWCLRELFASWMAQTPIGFIACDVTARRVQNWLYALSVLDGTVALSKLLADLDLIESIHDQVEFIIANLAPARNHRTLELFAVFLAGIALTWHRPAKQWLEFAVEQMVANIGTDLLDDGVHCELSTDYHHIVLRSYLLFLRHARIHDIELPPSVTDRITAALDFALHVHRPDGKIPALSDSDSRDYRELLRWGADLFCREDYRFVASAGVEGDPPTTACAVFDKSGYVIQRSPWQAENRFDDARYLVFDCGPMGAGNHGHMDALSIEVFAFGKPLIVDPGRYTYDESGSVNWRKTFRGTPAHNTVTVDDSEQARYKAGREGKNCKIGRPYPHTQLLQTCLDADVPYMRGKTTSPNYDATHEREIWFIRHRYWVMLDHLDSPSRHEYAQRFQFSEVSGDEPVLIGVESFVKIAIPGLVMLSAADIDRVALEDGYVSIEYGHKNPAPRLCVRKSGSATKFLTFLIPYAQTKPLVMIDRHEGADTVRIETDGETDVWSWNAAQGYLIHSQSDRLHSARRTACNV